ncbi:proteasome assembly chaperone family protein [[Eubacterium] cellulosolvens]
MEEEMKVIETEPIKKLRSLIIGLPDVGLVGLITVNHIIDALKLEEAGYFESDNLPPVLVIHKGEPKSPIRIFRKDDLSILTSEVPISQSMIPVISRTIIDWAKAKEVDLLISVSGIAIPNRLELEKPEVYGVASSNQVKKILADSKIEPLEEGFMVGSHASILKEAMKNEVKNITLMAQSHYQYPDPGAAAATITTVNRLLGLNIDNQSLLDQAEEIRLKLRELMQRTYKQMERMQKTQEQELPPMYV